jgi:riboflavin synthase
MFTGLVEEQGEVILNQPRTSAHRLEIDCPHLSALNVGESVAVNGVCLTLLPESTEGKLAFDVSPETLQVTTLGGLSIGDRVHLERALLAGSRLGGHYVNGHVDTTACIEARREMDECVELTVTFEVEALKYLVPKGSITLDGVSLTINALKGHCVHLLLIPHTLQKTTLGERQPGDFVNVEFDYLARIVAHQLEYSSIITPLD